MSPNGIRQPRATWSIAADVQPAFAVLAWSADQSLGGLAWVSAEDLPVDVALVPTATITGRLLDEQGQPLAGKELVQFHESSPPTSDPFHRVDQQPQTVHSLAHRACM